MPAVRKRPSTTRTMHCILAFTAQIKVDSDKNTNLQGRHKLLRHNLHLRIQDEQAHEHDDRGL